MEIVKREKIPDDFRVRQLKAQQMLRGAFPAEPSAGTAKMDGSK